MRTRLQAAFNYLPGSKVKGPRSFKTTVTFFNASVNAEESFTSKTM